MANKNLSNNESGNAYTWLSLCVILIIMSGVWLVTSEVVNSLISGYSDMTDRGMVTQDSQDCFNFNILLFKAFPVIMIFVLAIWAIIYTMKSKDGAL